MKFKLILCGLLLLGALTGIISLQTRLTRQILDFARKEAVGYGLELRDPHFESVGLAMPLALRWRNVRAGLALKGPSALGAERLFNVSAVQVDVGLYALNQPTLQIRAKGIRIVSKIMQETLKTAVEKPERIENGAFEARLRYDLFHLRKARRQAGALFHQMLALIRYGKTPLDFRFQAAASFEIRQQVFRARILSERQKGMTFLRMPPEDLRKISALLEEKLTGEEIRILSERPILAPQLLMIRNEARHTAYLAGKRDKRIPKDAYRHILWSYLLAREFGESFAKDITDAHEKGSILQNTKAQLAMDFHNNTLGRNYAKRGYAENLILQRLMKDPAVIRSSK